jgi:hypothetical protein
MHVSVVITETRNRERADSGCNSDTSENSTAVCCPTDGELKLTEDDVKKQAITLSLYFIHYNICYKVSKKFI